MKYIDLHTHSSCSDGSMSPAEVVRAAAEAGLSAIAISDHDTTAGIAEAAAEGKRLGIEVVPAIELSAASETETHVLGYYIDPDSPALREKIEYIRMIRARRELEICERLTSLGLPVTMEEVRDIAGPDVSDSASADVAAVARPLAGACERSVCRIHIARVMIKKGYVKTVREAFDRYLASGKPAYSPTQALTDEEAVRLIKEAGGLAFVAHLNQTKRPISPIPGEITSLYEFISRLKSVGLDGIEGYYTEYTPKMQRDYQSLARELGLIISGGSDFHGKNKDIALGALKVPYHVLEVIKGQISP